jgi:hypothetical protein
VRTRTLAGMSSGRRFMERLRGRQPEFYCALVLGDSLTMLLKLHGVYGSHVAVIAMLCIDVPIILLIALAIFAPEPRGACGEGACH